MPGYPQQNQRCPAGYYGLDRWIQATIVDQNITPFTADGITITETITLTRNDLTPDNTRVLTGQENTYGGGLYDDEFYFCSQVCFVSTGEIDATQNLGYGGIAVTVPNKIVMSCSNITFNTY
jgi:hypothetical protein